jgi:hypothetical protein
LKIACLPIKDTRDTSLSMLHWAGWKDYEWHRNAVIEDHAHNFFLFDLTIRGIECWCWYAVFTKAPGFCPLISFLLHISYKVHNHQCKSHKIPSPSLFFNVLVVKKGIDFSRVAWVHGTAWYQWCGTLLTGHYLWLDAIPWLRIQRLRVQWYSILCVLFFPIPNLNP